MKQYWSDTKSVSASGCKMFFPETTAFKSYSMKTREKDNIIESVDSICRDGTDTPIKP